MAQTEREKQLYDYLYGSQLETAMNTPKPEYAGTYEGQLNDLFDKISNREKFSYDVNADPLYDMYKDEYIQQGKLAMKDTMGQAAALTGGYGNTYGQQVGQQQYDAYLQKLSSVIPELYGMAYSMYQDEGDQLKDLYGMTGQLRDTEYGRYRDELSDWEYGQDLVRQAENQEYSRRMDEESIARQIEQQEYERRIYEEEVQRKLEEQAYQRQKDAYANLYAMIKASGYMPSEAELQAAGMSSEMAASLVSEFNRQILNEDLERDYRMYGGSSGGSSGGGGGYSSGGSSGYDSETAAIQRQLNSMGANLDVDGIWGPLTQAAYDKYMGSGSSGNNNLGGLSFNSQREFDAWLKQQVANKVINMQEATEIRDEWGRKVIKQK